MCLSEPGYCSNVIVYLLASFPEGTVLSLPISDLLSAHPTLSNVWGQSSQNVMLETGQHEVLRFRMCGAVPPRLLHLFIVFYSHMYSVKRNPWPVHRSVLVSTF
jgi:hypothetical protein